MMSAVLVIVTGAHGRRRRRGNWTRRRLDRVGQSDGRERAGGGGGGDAGNGHVAVRLLRRRQRPGNDLVRRLCKKQNHF